MERLLLFVAFSTTNLGIFDAGSKVRSTPSLLMKFRAWSRMMPLAKSDEAFAGVSNPWVTRCRISCSRHRYAAGSLNPIDSEPLRKARASIVVQRHRSRLPRHSNEAQAGEQFGGGCKYVSRNAVGERERGTFHPPSVTTNLPA